MKKQLLVLSIASVMTGCATTNFIGDHDQYAVHRDTGTFFGTMTPSVTIIEERATGKYQTYAGASAFSQVAGLAGTVGSAALISEGLKHAGTRISQTGGNTTSSAVGGSSTAKTGSVSSQSTSAGGAGGNSKSESTATGGESRSVSTSENQTVNVNTSHSSSDSESKSFADADASAKVTNNIDVDTKVSMPSNSNHHGE